MCGAALGLVQNRLELIGVELQEQKERFIRVVVLAAALVFLGNMAALVVTYTIVKLAGTEAEKPVLVILSLLYVVGAVITFLWLRKELRAGPAPLSDTVSELKKDRDWINSPK
jgi:uncharacterized membrane protein YqjE